MQIIVCATQATSESDTNNFKHRKLSELGNENISSNLQSKMKNKSNIQIDSEEYQHRVVLQNNSGQLFADDVSDITSLPPAPSRPEFQHHPYHHNSQDTKLYFDDDLGSMFSSIPAPPPPHSIFQSERYPEGKYEDFMFNEKIGYTENSERVKDNEKNKNGSSFENISTPHKLLESSWRSSIDSNLSEEGYSSDSTDFKSSKSEISVESESQYSIPGSPSGIKNITSIDSRKREEFQPLVNSEEVIFNQESNKKISNETSFSNNPDKPEPIYSDIHENDGEVIKYCPQSFNTLAVKKITKKQSFLSKLKSKVLLPSKSSLKQNEQTISISQTPTFELYSTDCVKSPTRQTVVHETDSSLPKSENVNFKLKSPDKKPAPVMSSNTNIPPNLSAYETVQFSGNFEVPHKQEPVDNHFQSTDNFFDKDFERKDFTYAPLSSSSSNGKSSYAAEGPTAFKSHHSFDKKDFFPDVDNDKEKTGVPFMNVQLEVYKVAINSSTSMPMNLNRKHSRSKESIPYFISDESKKRAPSLQELYFPPPPLITDIDEDSSPNSTPDKPELSANRNNFWEATNLCELTVNVDSPVYSHKISDTGVTCDKLMQPLNKRAWNSDTNLVLRNNPSENTLLNKTIRNYSKHDENLSSPLAKNPIAKPPREKVSLDQKAEASKSGNKQSENTGTRRPSNILVKDIPTEYQNISCLNNNLRQLPLVPNNLEECSASNISPIDTNELYASIDHFKKTSTKEYFKKSEVFTESNPQLCSRIPIANSEGNFQSDIIQKKKTSTKEEGMFKVEVNGLKNFIYVFIKIILKNFMYKFAFTYSFFHVFFRFIFFFRVFPRLYCGVYGF